MKPIDRWTEVKMNLTTEGTSGDARKDVLTQLWRAGLDGAAIEYHKEDCIWAPISRTGLSYDDKEYRLKPLSELDQLKEAHVCLVSKLNEVRKHDVDMQDKINKINAIIGTAVPDTIIGADANEDKLIRIKKVINK